MAELEDKKDENKKSYYYTNRVQILFNSEFPVSKEMIKPFYLTMLGSRLINIKVQTKKIGLMETHYEEENF